MLESVIPTATILASVVLLKERLVPVQWVGVGLSMAGALWVVTNGQLGTLTDGVGNLGDAIMVGAIMGWVIYTLQIKKCIHLFPAQASLFLNFLPVFTIAGSYVFLDDEVTGDQILGALAVICGVVLATYTGSRRPSTR